MKKYILRAPETDRKKVLVPCGAQDLDCSVKALTKTTTDTAVIENGATRVLTQETFTDLTNASNNGGGAVTVNFAGLYLIIVTAQWNWQTPGSITRSLGVSVNGDTSTYGIGFVGTVGDSHTDQFTALVRLAVGDYVAPFVQNINGGSSTIVMQSSMHLVVVAP